MEIVPQLFVVLLLILLNGFFVASEFVLIALRRSTVEEWVKKDNPVARFIKDALDHIETFISATQIGVTIISLLLGWVGEAAIAGKLGTLLTFLPYGPAQVVAHTVAIGFVFLLITYLQIVLGELVPKAVALQRTDLLAFVFIVPLTIFARVFHPFIQILNTSANVVLRFIRLEPSSKPQLMYSEEEMKLILKDFRQNGLIAKDEAEMAENVFKLHDIPVKQIMIPRTDVVAFEETTSFKKIVKEIENFGYSRYPVYSRSIDNIVGFIHVKDIYRSLLKMEGDKKLSQANLVRKILCVPEAKKADEVLLDMRKKHIHMAIVDDEFGGTAGIVSLEDIIESLVGEIQDEFDKPINEVKRQIDGSFLIDGRASIEAVQKRFRLPVKRLGYSTVGGFVFGLLGREPKIGDKVQLGNITFEVKEIDRKRVKIVSLRRETIK